MSSSCSTQKAILLECLADSACMASGRTIKECMDDSTENGCNGPRTAYFACKRGQARRPLALVDSARSISMRVFPWQLDMRKRIKGNILRGGDEDPRSKI